MATATLSFGGPAGCGARPSRRVAIPRAPALVSPRTPSGCGRPALSTSSPEVRKSAALRQERRCGSFGDAARTQSVRCAAASGRGALDPFNDEPRPWGDFLADVEPPPNVKAWKQRMRINAKYYRNNYILLLAGSTMLNATMCFPVFLGFSFMAAAAMLCSDYWTNVVLAPLVYRLTTRRLNLQMTLEGNPVLVLSGPGGTLGGAGAGQGVPVASEVYNPYQVAVGLLFAGGLFTLISPLFTFIVLMGGLKLGGIMSILHMTLRKPNLGSTISGLGNVSTREELNQNLKSIWDQLRGLSGE